MPSTTTTQRPSEKLDNPCNLSVRERQTIRSETHLLPQQDILLCLVRVDQAAFRVVVGVVEDSLENLVHRCDACPAGKHCQFVGVPGLALDEELPRVQVRDLSDRALDVNSVADLERVEELRHLATLGEPVVWRVDLSRRAKRTTRAEMYYRPNLKNTCYE